MSTQVQFRRGTTTQNNAFTGAIGEISVDTDLKTIRLHDGTTAGGGSVMLNNVSAQTALNKTFSTGSVWQGNAVGLGYGGTGSSLTAAAGAVPYSTSNGLALNAPGTSGQILVSGGTGAPVWVNASSVSAGTATLATTATNIAGGSAGQLIIQADTGLSTFITAGASGTFLKSAGAGYAPTWATGTITIGSTTTAFGDTSTALAGLTAIDATSGATSFFATPTTATLFNSATSITLGNGTASTLTVRPGTVVGTNATQSLWNITATTVNAFGAATSLNLGASTGLTTINNSTYVGGVLYAGSGANSVSLTSPAAIFKATGTSYAQIGMVNSSSVGSSDFCAYADNGTDIVGWADMGMTGSNFSDTNYTITGKNDGYLLVQPASGTGLTGNLVLATGGNGSVADIVLGTGGFLAANEKWRFVNSTGELKFKTPTLTSSGTTTANVFNSVVTTLNIGGAATTVNIGSSSGTTTVSNNLTVTGNLIVNGGTETVTSSNTSYSDSLIELHAPAGGGALSSNDGKDIGIRMHYYNGADKNAALVMANDTQMLEFYLDGTETSGVFSGTYGYFRGKGFNYSGSTGLLEETFSATTSSTTPTAFYTVPTATYRSGELTIQITNGTAYRITKMLFVHDGTNVTLSENYGVGGEIQTGATSTSISASIATGTLTFYATASTGTAVVKGKVSLIKV